MATVRFLMPIRASLSLLERSGNKESLARAFCAAWELASLRGSACSP